MAEGSEDKRKTARVRTILAARAILGKGIPDLACQVKDLSETGARIVIDETTFLPTRFSLSIPRTQAVHACELRWRSGKSVGLEFLSDARAPAKDQAAYIRELEAEIAALRRRVAEMAERLYALGDSDHFAI